MSMTKEELLEKLDGHEGDMNVLKGKLVQVVESVFAAIEANTAEVEGVLATIVANTAVLGTTLKTGGTGTAAEIAALEAPVTNAVYRVITTGGNLNSGDDQITVAVRDLVYHNGTKWVLFVDADSDS